MQATGEFGVLPEPEAVTPDVDDVAVMREPVDQCGGHRFVAERLDRHFHKVPTRDNDCLPAALTLRT